MAAGPLNTLIHILKPTDTLDPDTGETLTTYKRYHQKLPSKKEDISGGATRRGRQVEETVRTVFTTHFIEDIGTNGIDPRWRVEVVTKDNNGPTLEIVSIQNPDDRRGFMELDCADVK